MSRVCTRNVFLSDLHFFAEEYLGLGDIQSADGVLVGICLLNPCCNSHILREEKLKI